MSIHGDPVISGVTSEQQDKRSKCAWPIPGKLAGGSTHGKPCGSEDRVFNVKGSGRYTGRPRETPICEKHLPEAWKAWSVDSAEPLPYPSP